MRTGFKTLEKETSPRAFHDSGHEVDVPRCHENTRVAILEKIGDWVNLVIDITTFIMWLYGAAGAGKSAVARTVAEFLISRRQLLATFFFSREDSSRNNIRSVVATLAYNITRSVPESYHLITTTIANDPHIVNRSFAHQLKQLILGPLQKLSQEGVVYPTVIVIDGLDECLNHKERTALLHAISRATGQQFPPLKFLITSRPEVPIKRLFNATPVIEVSTRHSLDNEPEAIEDVKRFLSAKFDEIRTIHPFSDHIPPNWPSSQVLADLAQKSSGQFIHPVTIIRYISEPQERPTLRLNVVLNLQSMPGESPFAPLDALYSYITRSCKKLRVALRIIGICFLSTQAINVPWGDGYIFPSQITAPTYMESILGLHPGEVRLGLEEMGSLIEYKGDRKELRVLHTFLFDFLLDPARFTELPFNLASIRTDLAIWCSYLDCYRDDFQIRALHCEFDILYQLIGLG